MTCYSFRDSAVVIILAVALIAVPSCQAPAPETGGTVNAVISGDPLTLCLIGKTDRLSEVLARQVTDSLLQFDQNLGYAPRLAESWTISEDGLEQVFHLREGVKWHDGRPVTSDDVVFTVQKVRDPRTEARSYLAQFGDLLEITAPDPLTVKAVFSRPYADSMEAWTVPIIPRHIAGLDDDILTGEFSKHPVGCGPFKFVSHEPGSKIVLEANPDYWDGPPKIDRLVFRIFRDERTGYQALLNGDVDITALTPDLWKESKSDPRAERLSRFIYPRLNVWYIAWNQRDNIFFSDSRTRRAMMHALDRLTFAEQVLDGLAIPGTTTYCPGTSWHDAGVGPWPYDIEEAERLLREAGWADTDGDGRLDRDGLPFSFTLIYPVGTQEIADRVAVWVQQSLSEIGVEMKIDKLEWQTYRETRDGGRYQAAMASLSFSPTADQYELYHSSEIGDGYNFFGLDDPEVDRLVSEGRICFDPEKRRKIYSDLQHRLHHLEPLGCLFHFASPVLHHPALRGVTPTPIDFWRIYPGPRSWYWEPGSGRE